MLSIVAIAFISAAELPVPEAALEPIIIQEEFEGRKKRRNRYIFERFEAEETARVHKRPRDKEKSS